MSFQPSHSENSPVQSALTRELHQLEQMAILYKRRGYVSKAQEIYQLIRELAEQLKAPDVEDFSPPGTDGNAKGGRFVRLDSFRKRSSK